MMQVIHYVPPTPSPGEEGSPSPTVTTTTTTTPMEQLPVTGPTDDVAWGALALSVIILAVGIATVVSMRIKRAQEV